MNVLSTIAGAAAPILAPAYPMPCTLIPQYSLYGVVVVTGVYVITPVNRVASVPPTVSSPFWSVLAEVRMGAKETPRTSVGMTPSAKRVSM